MDSIQDSTGVATTSSNISVPSAKQHHQTFPSHCLNLSNCSSSLHYYSDCEKMDFLSDGLGFYNKCIFFYYHFLVIWWLNFILCSLSLTLSFNYRHSVVRSLVVFVLTIWEFTIFRSQGTIDDDPLLPLFVVLLRSSVFVLLLVDIVLDFDFLECVSTVYDHIVEVIFLPFIDFLEDYLEIILEDLPWIDDIIDGIDEISKIALCSSVWSLVAIYQNLLENWWYPLRSVCYWLESLLHTHKNLNSHFKLVFCVPSLMT